jgi:hypothetical protein
MPSKGGMSRHPALVNAATRPSPPVHSPTAAPATMENGILGIHAPTSMRDLGAFSSGLSDAWSHGRNLWSDPWRDERNALL